MDEYNYKTLNGPRSIRLLHLLEEPTDESISARLEDVQLEANPKYWALSYVWGKEEPAQSIRIGEQHIKIRMSLFQALKRVWKIGFKTIWADAVCINQSDKDERVQQVMIMRQIYESAALVIVHLGESSDAAKLSMLFSALLKLSLGYCQFAHNPNDMPMPWTDLLEQYGLPDPDQDVWQALVDLANHAWFRRAWTFQEVLVAKKCIFVRGDWSMFSNDVLMVFQVITNLKLSGYLNQASEMLQKPIYLAGIRSISVLRRQTMRCANQEISITWQRSPLIQLLRDSPSSHCSNPQDQIYSLLGVSHEADEEELKPSYIETVDQTFSRVARFFIKRGHGPQLLENTAYEIPPSTWPSWIPRWSDSGQLGENLYIIDPNYANDSLSGAPQFKASLNTKQCFQLDETENILIGRGVIFDTIKSVGSSELLVTSLENIPEEGPGGTISACSIVKYIDEIVRMLPVSLLEDLGKDFEKDVEKLFRTICDIAICEQVRWLEAPKSVWKGFGNFLLVVSQLVDPSEMCIGFLILTRIAGSIEVTTETKRLAHGIIISAFGHISRCLRCSTEKGHVGQVPHFAQVGDKIALLQGCAVPYLLREVEDRRYKVVSNCYLHGVMHGEAWPRSGTDVHEIWIV